jgi:hypothetical protein
MTAQTVVFVFGGLLILIAVIGGGFELKELRVPQVSGVARLLAALVGAALIALGVTLGNQSSPPAAPAPAPPPSPAPAPAPSPSPQPSKISVVAGTYGQNCGATYGNATRHLESECNNAESCVYVVDYQVIGDPAVGCKKNYLAQWKCGDSPTIHTATASPEAGFKTPIRLSCP